MKRIGVILRGMLFFLLAAVIAMNMVLLVKRLIYKEELPSVFGCSVVTVLSGSMEPEFSPGDMLVIRRQDAYQAGDVVTYEQQGSFITHRIIEQDETTCLTKGDANNAPDGSRIRYADIFGSVVLVLPGLGNVAIFLKSPLGALVLIIAFVLLIELSFRNDKRNSEREKKTE